MNPEQGPAAEGAATLSLSELLKRLIDDVSRLVRSEFRTARAEIGDSIDQAKKPLILILSGAGLLLGGLFCLLAALIAWLSPFTGIVAAALIICIAAGGIGYAMLRAGRQQLADIEFMPSRVANTTVENPDAFEGHDQ